MKQAFTLSASAHLFLAGLVFLAALIHHSGTSRLVPAVYRVSLVSLPALRTSVRSLPRRVLSGQNKKAETAPDQPAETTATVSGPALPPGLRIVTTEEGALEGSYYLGLIVAKIGRYWQNPGFGSLGPVRAQVYFKLDQYGAVQEVKMEEPSGQALFDQAALRAVFQARHFPPLPPELDTGSLGVHFEFEYTGPGTP
jgi:TonB family protein